MTKDEAIAQLELGQKLTHTYFIAGEFIYMIDGKIFDEDDVELNDFWNFRHDNGFQEGWGIYDTVSNDPFLKNF